MKLIGALSLVVATALSGCAGEVPVATNHGFSTQPKLKSSSHWNIIAADTAKEVAQKLQGSSFRAMPVEVHSGSIHTDFHKAFTQFLTTQLVRDGVPVVQAAGKLKISFEAQVVRHHTTGNQYIPGAATALTAGVVVLHDVLINASAGVAALAIAGTADAASNANRFTTNSKTEIIVTTSAVSGEQYVFRKSDVYYVEDLDGSLYEELKSKTWKVTGEN